MILNERELLDRKDFFINEIKKGRIFVYPTDTIYGIGCNAMNADSVNKIREIKKRDEKPFSVIVWNDWIFQNCVVGENAKKWIEKLPGQYTLILGLIERSGLCREVNNGGESIGIRIPKHWFSEIVEESKVPFITTSVNLSGERFIEDIREIPIEIAREVDYIIDGGFLSGKPSTIVFLDRNSEKVIERA